MPAIYKTEIANDGTLYTITFYKEGTNATSEESPAAESFGSISYRFLNGVWFKSSEDLSGVDEDSKQWARDEAQKLIDEVFPPSGN